MIASILFTLALYIQALLNGDYSGLYLFSMLILPYVMVIGLFWFALLGSVYMTKKPSDKI